MRLLEWKSEFDLGVHAMDRDHRGLLDAMNEIHALDARRAGRERIDAAIRHLIQLTVEHFEAEEVLMERLKFPDRNRHAFIHADMLRKVAEHHEAFQQGDGTVCQDFYHFLVHWLAAHICHIDREYAEHAAPVKSGS